MFEHIGKNILPIELEYTCISLISHKTKVVIIGGGKAGLIKCISFIKKGCNVTVVSNEFIDDFKILREEISRENINTNLQLIKDYYSCKYILDKHIVIIAVDDKRLINLISKDCENNFKLYLNCENFKEGNFVKPLQRESQNIIFSLHARGGSPKTSQFLADNIIEKLKDYDSLVNYIVQLRDKIKGTSYKNEILAFISSDDFKFFYEKGVHEKVLKMFYGGNNFEFKNSN